MPRHIIKLTDKETKEDFYLEWSTVVDAPITNGMTLEEFEVYYQQEYGEAELKYLEKRLERVEKKGTSSLLGGHTLEDLISINKAGDGETKLSMEEIIQKYCRSPKQATGSQQTGNTL
jgi:hypothetical protein